MRSMNNLCSEFREERDTLRNEIKESIAKDMNFGHKHRRNFNMEGREKCNRKGQTREERKEVMADKMTKESKGKEH